MMKINTPCKRTRARGPRPARAEATKYCVVSFRKEMRCKYRKKDLQKGLLVPGMQACTTPWCLAHGDGE